MERAGNTIVKFAILTTSTSTAATKYTTRPDVFAEGGTSTKAPRNAELFHENHTYTA